MQNDHLGDGHEGPDHWKRGKEGEDVSHDPGGNHEGLAVLTYEGQDPDRHGSNGSCSWGVFIIK